jgi:aryl-alcohol dehydrogenase
MLSRNVRANIEGGSIPDLFIPLLVDLWQKGDLPFDRLLGRAYAHRDIAAAIAAMESGQVIKPIVTYS